MATVVGYKTVFLKKFKKDYMSKIALVAGATGLVGKQLVNELVGNPLYQKVMVKSPILKNLNRLPFLKRSTSAIVL